ncbi:hypothetical protein KUCAC02_017242, partial [Chaenocephalus aceratus]
MTKMERVGSQCRTVSSKIQLSFSSRPGNIPMVPLSSLEEMLTRALPEPASQRFCSWKCESVPTAGPMWFRETVRKAFLGEEFQQQFELLSSCGLFVPSRHETVYSDETLILHNHGRLNNLSLFRAAI